MTPTIYPTDYSIIANETVHLTAVPANGYRFTGWSGSATVKTDTISLQMTCAKNLTASFVPIIYRLLTTVTQEIGGQVALEPPQPADGYVVGTRVIVHATPSKGYIFKEWTGGISGTDSTVTVTVDGEKLINATFVEKPSYLVWAWSGGGAGVVLAGALVYLFVFRRRKY